MSLDSAFTLLGGDISIFKIFPFGDVCASLWTPLFVPSSLAFIDPPLSRARPSLGASPTAPPFFSQWPAPATPEQTIP